MATSVKLNAGEQFPTDISVKLTSGGSAILGTPVTGKGWQAVFVYRGKHCPLCTRYLNEIESFKQAFADADVEVLAVSGDSLAQFEAHQEQLNVSFPIAYGLTEAQMQQLGLYISLPRSEQETDHNFAEPGLFVVNEQGLLHVVDISNNPFVRPELGALTRGLNWIKDPNNHYPIRGTANY
ncbi:redoxin domain-containing protein [Ferrimonas senticii]|uniref:redoxin domain-containing protein n=1 Tax=Ferrimonas senticii TaxID=394566 RepID=UPI000408ECBF|nr:redoxin domain-containing protein [Ferrimonas senticii]